LKIIYGFMGYGCGFNAFLKHFSLSFVFLLIISASTFAQTPGLIFKPAAVPGRAVLDPNGDGYTSSTSAGFTSDDKTQSEIPFVPLVFPMVEPTGDLGPGPDYSFTDFVDQQCNYLIPV
jgi:hypothetical protein